MTRIVIGDHHRFLPVRVCHPPGTSLINQKLAHFHGLPSDCRHLLALVQGQSPGHERPELLDGGSTGGAGRNQKVERLSAESVKVVMQQSLEGGDIPVGKRWNTATGKVFRQINPNPVMSHGLHNGLTDVREHLIDHAPDKEGDVQPGSARATGHRVSQLMKGDGGEGLEMAFLQGRKEPSAGGSQEVVSRFHEDPLNPCPPFQEAVEEFGMRQEAAENDLLCGMKPSVASEDGTRLEEHLQHLDAARTIGGTGAAEQATPEALVDPLGIFEQLPAQAVEEGQLAAGNIGFAPRLGIDRADRLAHPAAHADNELFLQFPDQPRQPLHIVHRYSPVILPGLRIFLGSRAALIGRE